MLLHGIRALGLGVEDLRLRLTNQRRFRAIGSPATSQGYGLVGALFNWVAALLNTLPMLFRRTSRMAMSPTATNAMIRAYSTRP